MFRPGFPPFTYLFRTNSGEFHPAGLPILIEEFEHLDITLSCRDTLHVEQVRGIFYTTQDTLLLTCRGEGSLLVVEEKREADDHIG